MKKVKDPSPGKHKKRSMFYLEDMEGFELDVSRFLFQHVHHQLQVVGVRDVASHHLKMTFDQRWRHDYLTLVIL
jgi:hypothetical protein